MGDIFIATSINSKIFYEGDPIIFNKLTTKKLLDIRAQIRNEYNTIIVGGNTIKRDNPSLLNLNKTNIRIIIDKYADLNINSNIFQKDPKKTYLIMLKKNDKYKDKLLNLGVNVIYLKNKKEEEIIKKIKELSVGKVLIEGGAKTIKLFLKNNFVENIRIIQFPIMLPEGSLVFEQYCNFVTKYILKDCYVIDEKYIYQCYKIGDCIC